jgi:gliding motility-associated lipoprotein GldH
LGVLLAGCSDGLVFQADTPIPGGAWSSAYKPEFAFDISDTVSKHDVFIDVRHTGEYPYSNLFLYIDLGGPGGRTARDTVECILADPTGRWLGRGTGFIFADRKQARVLYKLGNRFPAPGRYTIRLEQAMRQDPLPAVLDVGISVQRSAQQ